MKEQSFKQWALIELFGHSRIAGLVSEQAVGGCSFVRVDVPGVGNRQPLTRLFGNGAIYSITVVTEETALAIAADIAPEPIPAWDARKLLPIAENVGSCENSKSSGSEDDIPF